MSVTINGSSGLVFADNTAQTTAATCGLVNKIINGRMEIDQRNAGVSVTATTTGSASYTIDRWAYQVTQASKFTVQQNAGSVTPPAGFKNYLGVTSSSAYSVLSTDYFSIQQRIEGFNIADLNWGTANATTVTLSFWVRSSLTGTFGGALVNGGYSRSYPFSYSIPVANTWTNISITIAGDTTGTWATDNTAGIQVWFGLGMGSAQSGTAGAWQASGVLSATGATSVVGTNGATFYITGVDLRKGSAGATSQTMDVRPYGTELALCQRYYQVIQAGCGRWTTTNASACITTVPYLVSMRAGPTASLQGSGSVKIENYAGTDATVSSIAAISNARLNGSAYVAYSLTGGTGTTVNGYAAELYSTSDTAGIALSAEL